MGAPPPPPLDGTSSEDASPEVKPKVGAGGARDSKDEEIDSDDERAMAEQFFQVEILKKCALF